MSQLEQRSSLCAKKKKKLKDDEERFVCSFSCARVCFLEMFDLMVSRLVYFNDTRHIYSITCRGKRFYELYNVLKVRFITMIESIPNRLLGMDLCIPRTKFEQVRVQSIFDNEVYNLCVFCQNSLSLSQTTFKTDCTCFSQLSTKLIGAPSNRATSATTHVVLGQFKTCVILLGGFLLFGSNPGTTSILGAATALVGMSFYTYLNLHSKHQSAKSSSRQSSFSISKSKLGKENGESHDGGGGEECVQQTGDMFGKVEQILLNCIKRS